MLKKTSLLAAVFLLIIFFVTVLTESTVRVQPYPKSAPGGELEVRPADPAHRWSGNHFASAYTAGPGAVVVRGEDSPRALKKVGLEYTPATLYFNGRPFYFWSGEFPYYRLSPDEWSSRLDSIKKLGILFVTSYIPWNLHEYTEGVFDFTGSSGDERRNLVRFMGLIAEKGMYFIPKPGPFICGETRHGGIPDWLTDKHPGIVMQDHRGREVGFRQDGTPLPEYLNETYIRYVREWYKNVLRKAVGERQFPHGPVVALQVENEMIYSTSALADPFSWGYSDNVRALYRRWIQREYGDIFQYNSLHGTSYGGFGEIVQPAKKSWRSMKTRRGWLVFQDWIRFKEWYGAETLGTYAEILREEGATVPFYHNAGMLEDEAPMTFGTISDRMWIGVNFWLPFHPMRSLDSYTRGLRRIKQLRGSQPGRPSIAPELNWGWSTAEEASFLTRYTLPFLKGTNIYTIVDGDDAPNVQGRSYSNNREPYPGSAPIDAEGGLRPAYRQLNRLIRYTRNEAEDFASTATLADITLGFYPPYNYPQVYRKWGNVPGAPLNGLFESTIGANEFLQDFMRMFIKEDMECDAIDVQKASIDELLKKKLILLLGQEVMDSATQRKLVRYVQDGGRLVIFPTIPSVDLRMRKATILKDTLLSDLEIDPASGSAPWRLMLMRYPETSFRAHRVFHTLELHGGAPLVRAVNEKGEPVAAEKGYGKGKILYIGTYCTDPGFYERISAEEGLNPRYAFSSSGSVEVVPVVNPETGDEYLYAINRGRQSRTVNIYYRDVFGYGGQGQVSTEVGGHSCSIVKTNRGRLISASLNGSSGTFALVNGKGVWADGADEVDMSWEKGDVMQFSADRRSLVQLLLSGIRVAKVVDGEGAPVPYRCDGTVLRFHYTPGSGTGSGDDFYRIVVSGKDGGDIDAP